MGFVFASLGLVAGLLLGVALLSTLIGVASWGVALAPVIASLPPPVDSWALAVVGIVVPSWLTLLLLLALNLVIVFALYWIATVGTLAALGGPPPPMPVVGSITPAMPEPIGRGLMVGLNTGMNYVFLGAILAPLPGGGLAAGVLAFVNLLASVPAVSNFAPYQTVLGWTTLFLPMNAFWNGVGFLVLLINGVARLFGIPLSIVPDWSRANLVMHGGIVHGCVPTAYNMANFTAAHGSLSATDPSVLPGSVWPFCPALGFPPIPPNTVTRLTAPGVAFHEGTHTLNAGAYGWLFQWVGFADEFLPMPWSPGGIVMGANAYAELGAEGGSRGVGRNWITLWTPSPALTAPGNTPAVVGLVVSDATSGAPGVVLVMDLATSLTGNVLIAAERNRGIALDSSGTTDADGGPAPIGRLWLVTSSPPGSQATFMAPNAATTTFVPDVGGQYALQLHVTDGLNGGPMPGTDGPALLRVDVLAAVIATPGPATVGVPLVLDGSGSPPIIGGATTSFAWTIVDVPPGTGLALGPVGTGASSVSIAPGGTPPYSFEVALTVSVTVPPISGGSPITLSDTTSVVVDVTA